MTDIKHVMVVRSEPGMIRYRTAHVALYKTMDTFVIVTNIPSQSICVQLILKKYPRKSEALQSQVFMRVVSKEGAGLEVNDDGRPGWMSWHCS